MPRRDVALTDKTASLEKLKTDRLTPVVANWRR
jgi:hypothetical protein